MTIYSGDTIESLQDIAGQHLFIHGAQVKDWRGKLNIFVKGKGVWVEDIQGNRLLDIMAGLWYKAVGYGRTEIADAVYKQMLQIETPPANSALIPQIELSQRIASMYQDKNARIFFTSGGSESVETAVKMAKKWQALNGKPNAYKVISRMYSYHGSTAMAVSLGRANTADPMGIEMPGVVYIPNWDSYRLRYKGSVVDNAVQLTQILEDTIIHADPKTVAAIIAEPISAAAGIHPPPIEYWQGLRQIADKYDILLIADEVITGFGRTGEYFASSNFNVTPDITTVAKAITSGYAPLGATIASKKVADSFIGGQEETFIHLITFGGHPVSCAAALANLDIFKNEKLLENTKLMGKYLGQELQKIEQKHRIVGNVRGIGLLWCVELVKDKKTKQPFSSKESTYLSSNVPEYLYKRGVTSFRAGRLISICPPLTITKDEIDYFIDALHHTLIELEAEMP